MNQEKQGFSDNRDKNGDENQNWKFNKEIFNKQPAGSKIAALCMEIIL